jgi:hypothetical protein
MQKHNFLAKQNQILAPWTGIGMWLPAPLRAASLYSHGLHVVNLIRKLRLRPYRWSIYQRFKQYAWLDSQRLYVGNNHFENCEGDSAQLGLAIALLLNASAIPIRHAIATGSLSTDKHADYDVAIGAVGCIPEKLELLIAKRKAMDNALPDTPLYCFTPKQYMENGGLLPVASLPQIQHLAALGITVKPIAWLSEAAKILKADKARRLKQDKLVNLLVGVGLSLTVPFMLYSAWKNQPIALQMLPGKIKAEPFAVCTNRDNTYVHYTDLERDGGAPVLPLFGKETPDYNISLGMIFQPEKTLFSNQYYVAFIHLGEQTGYAIMNNTGTSAITVPANKPLKWSWLMKESAKEQNNVLMIVLQRTPIDADKLSQVFYQRFPDIKKPLDILKARDFLLPKFPGNYSFSYKSIIGDTLCVKP